MRKKRPVSWWLSFVFAAMAAVLGIWGYMHLEIEGKPLDFWDAVYYTLHLFPLSPLGKAYDLHWAVDIARFLAPLSLCAFAMSFLSKGVERVTSNVRSLLPDSVVVYGTNEIASLTASQNHWIHGSDRMLLGGNKNVILMDTDDDCFRFMKEHQKRLGKHNTYVGLNEMPSYLLRKNGSTFFFNVYEEIARDYWNNANLQEDMSKNTPYHIVMLNYHHDGLGYSLLKYGLLNNVFPDHRQVCYDIIGDAASLRSGFENLEMMNGDTIQWHEDPWYLHTDVLRDADRVILADGVSPQFLNQLIAVCTDQKIDYYTPREISYPDEYKYNPMKAFGITEKILNKDSVLKEGLVWEAKELNYEYLRRNGSPEIQARIAQATTDKQMHALADEYWGQLDGFVKNSNVAAADYRRNHRQELLECTAGDIDDLARAEHIRWCRFHFLNGWRYGEPEDGARKHEKKRIHRDLVPWEQLPEGEKEKNRQQIRTNLKMEGIALPETAVV